MTAPPESTAELPKQRSAKHAASSGWRAGIGRELAVLAGFLVAGVLATWPAATLLAAGRVLSGSQDIASYVWDFWWVAHCVTHLHDPWFSTALAAPAGVRLGFDTLMPLPCLLLVPVTLAFGPVAAYSLVVVLVPGLACYAMYRAARLWVSSQVAAVAAGALFGLSTMVTWQDQGHLNIAAGELFLPMALAAAVRLRRRPRWGQAVRLGVVSGAVFLVNQESAILVLIMVLLAVAPWLLAPLRPGKVAAVGAAVLAGLVVAAPQLVAMAGQAGSDGSVPAAALARWDSRFGVPLQTLFSPSPRLASFGLAAVSASYRFRPRGEGVPTFGLMLSLLAVLGLVVAWRRPHARQLALLWLGSAALALGTTLMIGSRAFVPLAQAWHGAVVSRLLPYTWLVRIPGLSAFREADRFTMLGLGPAALLAASAVDWLLARHRAVLCGALALGLLEAGWSAGGSAPAALPALDRPIAADRSGSIVVDVPFGLRGGVADYGSPIVASSLLLATQDGHPRAISYTSWVPAATVAAMSRHPFYADLVAVQRGWRHRPAALAAARADARQMRIGWALVWQTVPGVASYLDATGFRFSYRAAGVRVWRR